MVSVVIMPTIYVSDPVHNELKKIKGIFLAKDGQERSFDEIISELIACWKEYKG